MAKTGSGKGDELPPDIHKLSFEVALHGLEEIVQRLESGDVSLEDSIDIYTRGTQLKRHCEAKLRDAKSRVEKIVLGPAGAVDTNPADSD